MRKATSTNRVLIALTLLFLFIAAFSFAAFSEAKQVYCEAKNCIQATPSQKGGEMLWDGFSRRFVSLISIN